jgi:hypothetical protein
MKTDFTEEFEQFWALYPTRYIKSSNSYVKIGKALAFQYWRQLPKESQLLALEAVKHLKSGEYIKDCFRWLRDKNWLDYSPMPEKRARTPQDSKSQSGVENWVKCSECGRVAVKLVENRPLCLICALRKKQVTNIVRDASDSM